MRYDDTKLRRTIYWSELVKCKSRHIVHRKRYLHVKLNHLSKDVNKLYKKEDIFRIICYILKHF